MSSHLFRSTVLLVCLAVFCIGSPPVAADTPELVGHWYGVGDDPAVGLGDRLDVLIFEPAPGYLAGLLNIPVLGYNDLLVPVTRSGNLVTIGDPNVLAFVGEVHGDHMFGTTVVPVPFPPYVLVVDWQLWKDTGQGLTPGALPTQPCPDLPALYCLGSAAHCGELVPFEPVEGPGYMNNPLNGETWDDQYRSFLRRDLRQIVKYATAKVAWATSEWDYWDFAPLGMADMSEADGSIPGTSVGYPGHPPGTHENGLDIDLAYYQLFAPGNHVRVIGTHHDELGVEQWHLLEPPRALDVWRTALLLVYLTEHPRMRVIGVDGLAGLMLEDALDELVGLGWISAERRSAIPLAYEVVDTGLGWFRFHHHHVHVSLNPLADIVESVDIKPAWLLKKGWRRTVTAYVELKPGYDVGTIATGSVALLLDGHTPLYAKPCAKVGDYDRDGIPDLRLRFDRRRLLKALGTGKTELTLIGRAGDLFFRGTDTVRVIRWGRKKWECDDD